MRLTSPNKAFGLAIAGFCALASPALASGGVFCEGDGGHIDIAMGRLVVMQVLGASAEIGGQSFSTGPERGEGEAFAVGQAFAEGDDMMVDFVDPNFEAILVSLRAQWNSADETWLGTLSTPAMSVSVVCMEG